MSIKLNSTKILANSPEELDELVENLEINLKTYQKKHGDFSCVIEKHTHDNTIIVKSIFLEEHVN